MNKHYTASSRSEMWSIANKIFPTDYKRDERASANAGYPIYWSTERGVNAWISDLNTCLELNMTDGSSIYIDHVKPVKNEWNYDGQY